MQPKVQVCSFAAPLRASDETANLGCWPALSHLGCLKIFSKQLVSIAWQTQNMQISIYNVHVSQFPTW